jgi:hypothetical protein
LKRCDGKVESLCVEKFRCDGKVGSLKKKFGTKVGMMHVEHSHFFYEHVNKTTRQYIRRKHNCLGEKKRRKKKTAKVKKLLLKKRYTTKEGKWWRSPTTLPTSPKIAALKEDRTKLSPIHKQTQNKC